MTAIPRGEQAERHQHQGGGDQAHPQRYTAAALFGHVLIVGRDGPAVRALENQRGLAQHVTHTAQGVQQALLTGVDLAAQVGHIGLDDVDVAAEVVTPHMVEDLGLGQHRAGVDDEVAEQREFRRRQRDGLTGLPHLVGVLVEFDIGERQPGIAGFLDTAAGAAQDDPQPGHHLFQAERLGDVVVATEREPGDLVLQGVAGGEEQGRGGVDTVGSQPTQHAEAVHPPRHHHVEDHRVGLDLARLVQRGRSVGCGVHLETLELQAHREQLDDVHLVVHHEDPRFGNAFRYRRHSHTTTVHPPFGLILHTHCEIPVNLGVPCEDNPPSTGRAVRAHAPRLAP